MSKSERLGKVFMTVEGPWDANAEYPALCMVEHDHKTYVSRKKVLAGTPLADSEYWYEVLSASDAIEAAEDAHEFATAAVDAKNEAVASAAQADEAAEKAQEAAEKTEVDLDVKLDKPPNPSVGKVLKVLEVNDDGTFTCEWADDGGVTGVNVNGESVVNDNGVAEIPVASPTVYGALRRATNGSLDGRSSYYAITGGTFDYAVKAALSDGKGPAYSDDEQLASRERLGAASKEEFDALDSKIDATSHRVEMLESKTPAQKIIEDHISATPDYGTYTVRFPKWETSHTANGEKLDDNQGLILTPATDTVKEINTYPHCFDTIDVNAYVDEDGVRHITAIKGDKDFRDTGKVDVFVCLRTYWEKCWEENGYEYYSRCYYPKEGYTINRLAVNRDGTYNSWFLIAKYMAGAILDDNSTQTHKLYSSKGLSPAHYIGSPVGAEEISDSISWSGMQPIFKRRGTFYTGSIASEMKHFTTSMWLYFATKNSQSVMYGYGNSSFQYICAEPTENVNYFVVTASQANNIDLLQCVSIGDNKLTTAPDRNTGLYRNIANDVRVIKKETLESDNVAIYVDHDPFTTTTTSWMSSFHDVSGYSDFILGRNGSPTSNTNGRHGMVLDGIELMVGGYEVCSNVIFNATSNPLVRELVMTNDATKLSTSTSVFMTNAIVLPVKTTVEKNATWQYVTDVALDLENGIVINTKSGQDGAGSTTGYCDAQYFDAITSGQREILSLGRLGVGSYAGLRCVGGNFGVSFAYWDILARLSVNAVGGELR